MNFVKLGTYIFILLLTLMSATVCMAQNSVLETTSVLAVIPVNGKYDKSVYKQFDHLIPELRKISKNQIVKLECKYSGRPDREQDVITAYQIAGQIEKYLRLQHKLELDLWITIQLGSKQSKMPSTLTIALFADDVNRLNSIPMVPNKEGDSSPVRERL